MFKNLLFDWSGTLCNDMALTIEATNYVLSCHGKAALNMEEFRAEFQLPYPDYYAWKTPGVPLETLEREYRYAFAHAESGVFLLPYAREFMAFCKARGIRCFALTSMDPKAFEEQSRDLGIWPYFEHVHSGIHNKEHHIGTLMAQHGLKPEETAFIGDMQHDMRAAHCAGVTAIGVLTGYNNAEQLAVSAPDITVPDLSYLRRLMERVPAAPRDTIHINGLRFRCRIGVPAEERAEPQELTANITITPPLPFAAMGEDIARTIDYDALSRRLVELAQAQETILLETLAQQFADCCRREFGAARASVELHKYILPNTASVSVRTEA
ncbi:MAG: dihydroneopterin aldolase [Akkermansia sp.]|nr:dihydroneopterin aldolase [Akkermansia sp.]